MSEPTCFHCGSPVTVPDAPRGQVEGRERVFCCPGCLTVCSLIVEAGHGDFYRYRDTPAPRVGHDAAALERLRVYDRPEVQGRIVRCTHEGCEVWLVLEEIRCAACLWLNERALRALDGVLDVHVDPATHRARVRWDPQRVRLSQILAAIAGLGYSAHPFDPTHTRDLEAARRRRGIERLVFAGFIGMPVMQFALTSYLLGGADAALPLWERIGRWGSLVATAAILGYSGQDFFAGAWADLRRRRLGMDVPIALGLSVAWLGSLYATWKGAGEVYFDSIAMLVFLVLLARHVELRGRLAAVRALDRLGSVLPRTARRLESSGEREVAVSELAPGDRIRVLPGEALPTDGVVERGVGEVDESLLTGEPSPVPKRPGDPVAGGSLNGASPLQIRVTQPAAESAAARIQRLVQQGLEARPGSVLLAEAAARVFVPVVIVVAVLTGIGWAVVDPARWIHAVVAVLMVTCPCALALAAPVARTLAAAGFARLGVLPLRMERVEVLARAEVLACDKTGTLTRGRPALLQILAVHGDAEEAGRDAAVSLARCSAHPLARALARMEAGAPLAAHGVRTRAGDGVEGEVGGRVWRLGRPEFVLEGRPDLDVAARARLERLAQAGRSLVLIGERRSGGPVVAFVLEDPPRPGLDAWLAAVRRQGVHRVALLSGDRPAAVAAFARGRPFDEVRGGLRPHDKLAWIRERQAGGARVWMLGDGINDAPTLAAADVSVSFASAADVAQARSDFVVLGDSLEPLIEARRLACRTRRIVMQNLLWAAAYNLAAVPLAAAGWIPPWAAALGMAASSLLVVGNALRLRARAAPRADGSAVPAPTPQPSRT